MKIEIVGGAAEYEAAAIVAAVQAVLAEHDARARRPATTSRWKHEPEEFRPGRWGPGHHAAARPEQPGS